MGCSSLDDQIFRCYSKTVILQALNLVTFSFYLLDTFWPNFSKISLPRGAAAIFKERSDEFRDKNLVEKPVKCDGGIIGVGGGGRVRRFQA